MTRCVTDICVMVNEDRAHRRVELFLFSDSEGGPFQLLSFSGGHGRLPSLQKGQGPMQDLDNARYVLHAIVRELEQMGYETLRDGTAIWEVYARKMHRQRLAQRQDEHDR